MASLVKNGETYGLVWTDSSRGQPQTRESLKTSDLATARRRKARLEADYWEGDHDPWERKWYEKGEDGQSVRMGEAVERFIRYKSAARGRDGWNEATAQKEAYVMRNFAEIIGEDTLLENITNADTERVYYREGVTSDHTRNSDYISLTAFFNWAAKKGWMEDQPDFRPPAPQTKVPKFITPAQLAALTWWKLSEIARNIKGNHLYEESEGAYWIPMGWMVLAGTGLRPIELANLKLSHIEGDSIIVGEDFTTKVRAERRVPLLFEAGQAAWLLSHPRFRALQSRLASPGHLLGRSPSHTKRKLSEEFSRAWQSRFPDKPKRTLYNLKNTFAVRFLCDDTIIAPHGIKLLQLRDILGHSSIKTTERYLEAIPYGTNIVGTIWDHPPVSQ